LEAGQFKRSANVFILLLHRDPDRVRILVGLGVSLRKLGQYENACVAFQEAMKIEPRDPRGPYQLGITLILLGKGKAGKRLLMATLAICDRDADRWSSLQKLTIGIVK
jgi:Flp pilus assembly protein TadD